MVEYLFTFLSGIGFLLSMLTGYVGYKSPNGPWATVILATWIFSWNFMCFIDSIVWSGSNPEEWWDGKIYCDVNSRIKDIIVIGIPGASVGLLRFFAKAVDPRFSLSVDSTFKNSLLDLLLGVIFPFVIAGLRFIVMPSRYNILGAGGCTSMVDNSWPSIVIFYIWPPAFSLLTAIYAGIFLYRWWQIRECLNRDRSLNMLDLISRVDFLRLLITATTVIIVYFPLSIVGFVKALSRPRHPYSLDAVYGPQWAIIVKRPERPDEWGRQIGPFLAIQLFCAIGMTKVTKQLFDSCTEWIRAYSSSILREMVSAMEKMSAKWKQSGLPESNDLEL